MLDVEAINVAERIALLSDGSSAPITNLFDADGEETVDADEAVAFVAGAGAQWFAGRIDSYQRVTTY